MKILVYQNNAKERERPTGCKLACDSAHGLRNAKERKGVRGTEEEEEVASLDRLVSRSVNIGRFRPSDMFQDSPAESTGMHSCARLHPSIFWRESLLPRMIG